MVKELSTNVNVWSMQHSNLDLTAGMNFTPIFLLAAFALMAVVRLSEAYCSVS